MCADDANPYSWTESFEWLLDCSQVSVVLGLCVRFLSRGGTGGLEHLVCKVKRPYKRGAGPLELDVQVQGAFIIRAQYHALCFKDVAAHASVLLRNC